MSFLKSNHEGYSKAMRRSSMMVGNERRAFRNNLGSLSPALPIREVLSECPNESATVLKRDATWEETPS